MSLASWQAAVVEMVSHGSVSPGGYDDLDHRERAWIDAAVLHTGTAVTSDVVRSWRRQRVGRSVPLVLLALRRWGLLEEWWPAYLAGTFAPSSYANAEGRQFLDFVELHLLEDATGQPDHAHLATLVELERAVLAARASTWSINIRASRADDSVLPGAGGLVRAGCDGRELLRGLLGGSHLPAPGSGEGAFLVAPGIPGCFREATIAEIQALTLIGAGCPVAEVAGLWPHDLIDLVTLTRLEAVGALVRQPPPARLQPPLLVGAGRSA